MYFVYSFPTPSTPPKYSSFLPTKFHVLSLSQIKKKEKEEKNPKPN